MQDLVSMIEAALREDIPNGDVTTDNLALGSRFGTARLVAKSDLVLSGCELFEQTVLLLEPQAKITWHKKDGDAVLKSQTVCTILGDMIQVLKAERTALNFIQHLSGVASLTAQFVAETKHTSTKILDTRKTLPGYRTLEKKAVRHGGGTNHRKNLSDAILVKDNHIAVAGSIRTAVERIRAHSQLPICVEAATLPQVQECVELKVERILLDNMSNETIEQALQIIPDEIEVEASGNMSLNRVRSVAELGVDFISVGALTHSSPAADLSLLFDWKKP